MISEERAKLILEGIEAGKKAWNDAAVSRKKAEARNSFTDGMLEGLPVEQAYDIGVQTADALAHGEAVTLDSGENIGTWLNAGAIEPNK